MPYTLYKPTGAQGAATITVPDNVIDSTSFYDASNHLGIQLLGQNAIGYGTAVAQNTIQMLSNFAGSVLPANDKSLQGQLWFQPSSSTPITDGSLYVKVNSTTGAGATLAYWNQLLAINASGNVALPPGTTMNANITGSVLPTNASDANTVRQVGIQALTNIATGTLNYPTPAALGLTLEYRRSAAGANSVGTFQLYSDGTTTVDYKIRKVISVSGSVETWSPWSSILTSTSTAPYVRTIGDTMTGDLTISKASPYLIMNKINGNSGGIIYYQGGSGRWVQGANNTPETGSNAGSDYSIYRYNDAGTLLGASLLISRATGASSFSGDIYSTTKVAAINSGIGGLYLATGDSSHTGSLAFQTETGVRQAYIGYDASSLVADAGNLTYTAGNHIFTGRVNPTEHINMTAIPAYVAYTVGSVPDTWSYNNGVTTAVANYGMTTRIPSSGGHETAICGYDGLIFGAGGTKMARIDSVGLSVFGTVTVTGVATASGFTTAGTVQALTVTGGTGGISTTGTLSAAGVITCSSTVTATDFIIPSDDRLKTNWMNQVPNFVSKLAQVKSGIYERISDKTTQVGISAQSLQTVMPEAVHKDNEGMYSVSYATAALAACIELAKEVQSLKAEIAQLRAQ